MAHVYLALNERDEPVVLKTPRVDDPHVWKLFHDEARVGMLLQHPNVVQTLDIFEEEGWPIVVLNFVSGHTLSALRRIGPMPTFLVADIGAQVARALDAIHLAEDNQGRRMNIVHRDVTPGNILVSADGFARLIDLGIAKFDDRETDATATGMIRGTMRYLAPEIFDKGLYSPASDLWALGVTLLDMALGRRAVPGSEAEVIAAIVRGRVPEALNEPSITPELAHTLRPFLEMDPRKRVASAAEAVPLLDKLKSSFPRDERSFTGYWEVVRDQLETVVEADTDLELVQQATAIYSADLNSVVQSAPSTKKNRKGKASEGLNVSGSPSEAFAPSDTVESDETSGSGLSYSRSLVGLEADDVTLYQASPSEVHASLSGGKARGSGIAPPRVGQAGRKADAFAFQTSEVMPVPQSMLESGNNYGRPRSFWIIGLVLVCTLAGVGGWNLMKSGLDRARTKDNHVLSGSGGSDEQVRSEGAPKVNPSEDERQRQRANERFNQQIFEWDKLLLLNSAQCSAESKADYWVFRSQDGRLGWAQTKKEIPPKTKQVRCVEKM